MSYACLTGLFSTAQRCKVKSYRTGHPDDLSRAAGLSFVCANLPRHGSAGRVVPPATRTAYGLIRCEIALGWTLGRLSSLAVVLVFFRRDVAVSSTFLSRPNGILGDANLQKGRAFPAFPFARKPRQQAGPPDRGRDADGVLCAPGPPRSGSPRRRSRKRTPPRQNGLSSVHSPSTRTLSIILHP
jgi:hypothetical protein